MIDFNEVRLRRERAWERSVQLARIRAHKAFDVLWRQGYMSRDQAYRWLAAEFGREEIHMAWMSIEECARVVKLVKALLSDLHVDQVQLFAEDVGAPRDAREAREAFRKLREGKEEQDG